MECLSLPARPRPPTLSCSRESYAELLRSCTSLAEVKHIHARIASQEVLSGDRFLCNLLVQMYARCGSLEQATECFRSIPEPNVFSWTILVAANAQNGDGARALYLLHRMHLEGVKPNSVTFTAASAGCTDVLQAKLLCEQALVCGFEGDARISNILMKLHGKCGRVEEARQVFEGMQHRDVVPWTCLIWAYAENGQGQAAVQIFEEMCCEGIKPDAVCFVAVLDAVAVAGDQRRARMVHALVSEVPWSDAEVLQLQNTLINMYGKCGLLEDAIVVFEEMEQRETVSWNSAITAFAQNGQPRNALRCYAAMLLDGGAAPSNVTFVSTAAAAGETGDRQCGEALHRCACESGLLDRDAIVRSSLLGMYGRWGNAERAEALLRSDDAAGLTTMVTVFSKLDRPAEALLVFRKMLLEGLRPGKAAVVSAVYAAGSLSSSVVMCLESCVASCSLSNEVEILNSILASYSRLGELEEAKRVFNSMVSWSRNESSWTSMIAAYTQHQEQLDWSQVFQEILPLFGRMQLDGVKPNGITMVVLMDACANAGKLAKAEELTAFARELRINGSSSSVLSNCLLKLYVRSGRVDQAREMLLHGMVSRDLTSWNTVMAGLAAEGQAAEAVVLLAKMEAEGEAAPDAVTLTIVLDACTTAAYLVTGSVLHERLVAQGYLVAGSYNAVVATALVNYYGKCGDLVMARQVFNTTLEGGSSDNDVVLWNAMLVSYSRSGELAQSRELFHEMALAGVAADKNSFVSLLFACSHAGLETEARMFMLMMSSDFEVSVAQEHWTCMLDLLGRRGQLADAESLLCQMRFLPDAATCMTLLSWRKTYGQVELLQHLLSSAEQRREVGHS